MPDEVVNIDPLFSQLDALDGWIDNVTEFEIDVRKALPHVDNLSPASRQYFIGICLGEGLIADLNILGLVITEITNAHEQIGKIRLGISDSQSLSNTKFPDSRCNVWASGVVELSARYWWKLRMWQDSVLVYRLLSHTTNLHRATIHINDPKFISNTVAALGFDTL